MAAISPVAAVALYTCIDSGASTPSVISSEIEKMERSVVEIVRQLKSPSHDPEKVERDARFVLVKYHQYLCHLLTHSVPGDDAMICFGEDESSLAEGQYPTPEEIQRCKCLITQIKSCPIDLSKPEPVKSYQELAWEVENVYDRISQMNTAMEGSIGDFLSYEEDVRTISPLELRGLKAITYELHEEMRKASELTGEHIREEINSFTIGDIGLFTGAATRVNRLAQNMIGNISYVAQEQLAKQGQGGLTRPFPPSNTLREIKDIIEEIRRRFIVDESVFTLTPQGEGASSRAVEEADLMQAAVSEEVGGSAAASLKHDPSTLSLPRRLQVSTAKGITSYHDLAVKTEAIYNRIVAIGHEIGDSVSEFLIPAAEFRIMSGLEIRGLKGLTSELDDQMKIVFKSFSSFEKGEFSGLKLDGQSRFTEAVRHAKQIGREIVSPIFRVSLWELSKYPEDGEAEAYFSFRTLKEIKNTSIDMLGYL